LDAACEDVCVRTCVVVVVRGSPVSSFMRRRHGEQLPLELGACLGGSEKI